MNHVIRIALVFASSAAVGWGQESSSPATTNQGKAETRPQAETDTLGAKLEDSSDDLWTRKYFTGDWGGVRTNLADHGIKLDFRLTQYYQGIVSGGANTTSEYGGKLDYILNIDGHKLGLWEGLFVNVHAETHFGLSIDGDAGAFALPNTAMLYPLGDEHETAITGLLVTQALSKNFALFGGKINALDFWTQVYPHVGGGVEGFQNINMIAATLPFLRYVNLSMLGAGALVLKDDGQVQGAFAVYDTHNSTTTTGFDDAFHDGAGFLGLWKFFFDINEKPGDILIAFGGSTRRYKALEKTATTEIPGEGLSIKENRGAWTAAVYYNQILWQTPDDDKRNVRLFTGWAVSDGDASFGKWSGFASLEQTGLLFDRERDRAGFGGFYNDLSNDFENRLSTLSIDVGDMWGMELYYNAEITPWFHLTGDVQFVQDASDDDNPAVILGLRAVIDF